MITSQSTRVLIKNEPAASSRVGKMVHKLYGRLDQGETAGAKDCSRDRAEIDAHRQGRFRFDKSDVAIHIHTDHTLLIFHHDPSLIGRELCFG
jgi:hypothetical protein